MKKLEVKGYATYDKLKTCIVGRTYGRDQFKNIENQRVKDVLFKILDETGEEWKHFVTQDLYREGSLLARYWVAIGSLLGLWNLRLF